MLSSALLHKEPNAPNHLTIKEVTTLPNSSGGERQVEKGRRKSERVGKTTCHTHASGTQTTQRSDRLKTRNGSATTTRETTTISTHLGGISGRRAQNHTAPRVINFAPNPQQENQKQLTLEVCIQSAPMIRHTPKTKTRNTSSTPGGGAFG